MIEVVLTDYEIRQAAHAGVDRQVQALVKGLPDRHGFQGSGWDVHIDGALGELAVAKALNRFWSASVGTFKTGGDVGSIQVRCRSRHDYELLVRDTDPDDAAFILVTGRAPTFRVHGWIYGRDAKRPEWRQTHGNRPPAYFVPHSALQSLERPA